MKPTAVMMLALALSAPGAQPASTNVPPAHLLLLDSLGRVVRVPTHEVHHSLLPPADPGLKRQTPSAMEGMSVPDEVLQRMQQGGAGREEVQFFPAVRPRLMPYLAGFDEHGNTALRPGALSSFVPLDALVQGGKYWLGEGGLRYSLQQSFSGLGMSDVMQGSRSLGFYTFDLKAKWAVLDAPGAGTAGWISTQVEAKTGLGDAGGTQSPKSNLGTLTEPNYTWSSVNGVRVPELAWQQSLRDGEVVLVAGMVSQRNYLDGNAAAHTARGEFMNSALVHSQVLPLADYNFGVNLQWQPQDEWYAMLGASAGQAPAGQAPWTDFSWNHGSLVGEFGYAPKDFFGLGPGVYRLQPFVAEAGGPAQAGLGFNFQQHLGPHSPFAWFGRFGFGGSEVSAGAGAQIGTGFILQAPLEHAGLVPRLSNDLLGLGFVWSQPSATSKTIYHQHEYILESFYTLQLTPTVQLQPDLQVVWNPAFNPESGPALVAQLQLNLAW
jgi:porin